MAFAFREPGVLQGDDFYLVLAGTTPAAPERGIVPAYAFHVKVTGSDAPVGRINLRIGTNEHIQRYAGNLGYQIEAAHRGRRLAERAIRLILPIARSHGMTEIWVGCNPDNHASRRTCERLGAELVEIIDVPRETIFTKKAIARRAAICCACRDVEWRDFRGRPAGELLGRRVRKEWLCRWTLWVET